MKRNARSSVVAAVASAVLVSGFVACARHSPAPSAAAQRKPILPCLEDSAARGLDFLIGDWDLQNARGVVVQHTVIHQALGGCALVQDDTVPANGYIAVAIHQWERERRLWRQGYADNRGAFTTWHGKVSPGRIEYAQDSVPGFAHFQRSIFWSVDADHVRQTFDESDDAGKTWKRTFDGTYVRRTRR
jgi:hypothetical protein